MSWNHPPHRLRTADEVRVYARRLGSGEAAALVDFASGHELSIPPILRWLPEKVQIPLHVNRARRAQPGEACGERLPATARAALVAAALRAPATYDGALTRLVETGERLLRGAPRRGRAQSCPGAPPGPLGPVFRMLSLYEDVPKVLAEALRRYLNTRDEAARAFLSDALSLLLLYEKDLRNPSGPWRLDRALVDRCAGLDLGEEALPEPLFRAFRVRHAEVRWELFRPYFLRFLSRFRESVHRVGGLPANLKTNAFSVMRQVVDGKRAAGDARRDLEQLDAAYAGQVPADAAKRYRSVLANFFEKLTQADRLFDEVFGDGATPGRSPRPDGDTGSALRGDLVIEAHVADPAFLTAYPTKDYLDLLKGLASGDCTAQEDLRGPHLLHPRFFNVRLFHREAWVGNVYALDFTDQRPATVVLDKIQSRNPERYLPEPVLRGLLYGPGADPFRAIGVQLLAPSEAVSNASWVRDCFATITRHRRRVSFSLGPGERCFESSRRTSFVVLVEPGSEQ